MPVGRVEYCFLVPLSFQEFLSAVGDERLVALLNSFHLGSEIAGPSTHNSHVACATIGL